MLRSQTVLTGLLLAITLAWPIVTFGYINAGFRSQEAYDRYLAKRGPKRNDAVENQKAEQQEWLRETERKQQRYIQQLGTLNAAIQRDPNDLVAIYQRGKFFQSQNYNEHDKAMADFDQVIERDPEFARAYFRRSFLWLRKKDYRRTLSDLDASIRLEPTYPISHFHRATLLMGCPDQELRSLKESRQSIQASVDLTKRSLETTASGNTAATWNRISVIHAYSCGLLAAIAAELGDFPAAIHWETEASKFPPRGGQSNRLSLYQSGKTDHVLVRESQYYLTPFFD